MDLTRSFCRPLLLLSHIAVQWVIHLPAPQSEQVNFGDLFRTASLSGQSLKSGLAIAAVFCIAEASPLILRTTLVIAAIATSLFFVPIANAALIYDLADYPAHQNGHSLSGTITTTDTAPDDGQLMATEILAWEFEIIGPHGFGGALSDPNSHTSGTGVMITPTEIILPYPPITFFGVYGFTLRTDDGTLDYVRAHDPFGVGFFNWYRAYRHPEPDPWFADAPLMNNAPPNHETAPWVVATRVPEPSGFMLVCSLAGAVLFRRSLRKLARNGRST